MVVMYSFALKNVPESRTEEALQSAATFSVNIRFISELHSHPNKGFLEGWWLYVPNPKRHSS